MEYAFLLAPHANTRYADSLRKLAHLELQCMLDAAAVTARTEWREMGGAPWFVVSCPPLPGSALHLIAGHSSFYMGATLENGLLNPLSYKEQDYLPSDLAEVLKYKGKTNAAFTRLMLNCALCASEFHQASHALHVLDPLCGKATSLFCALQRGFDATGVDEDSGEIKEAADYLTRYLQLHKVKHQLKQSSLTLPGGKSAPALTWQLADTPAHYQAGETRKVLMICGDTLSLKEMLKPETAHLLIADLPYGVQHAPRQDGRTAGFLPLLKRAAPVWRHALKPGGALALSFNTHTLKKIDVRKVLADAGLRVLDRPPYDDFDHWVEQAVQRDLVVACKD